MMRSARIAMYCWATLSLLVAASLGAIYLRLGAEGFAVFIQQPPLINLPVTLSACANTPFHQYLYIYHICVTG